MYFLCFQSLCAYYIGFDNRKSKIAAIGLKLVPKEPPIHQLSIGTRHVQIGALVVRLGVSEWCPLLPTFMKMPTY